MEIYLKMKYAHTNKTYGLVNHYYCEQIDLKKLQPLSFY